MKRKTASGVMGLGLLGTIVLFVTGSNGFTGESASQQAVRQAYQKLLSTNVSFAFGGVGFAGVTSDGEKAFHTIAGSTNALELFRAIARDGNPEGQMYGLCGIRKLEPESFDAFAKPIVSANPKVWTMSGCLRSEEPAPAVVRRIARGSYDRDFEKGRAR